MRPVRKELIHVIRKASASDELLDSFLTDLLTPEEYANIATRWQIILRLNDHVPQRQISKELKVSIAQITRGSKELSNPKGGFQRLLGKNL
ncbi:trp operon repressor [Patescibacteria group bacterium]|nr:trp operon repressor [Patescibacteria group bacterium]